MCTAHFLMPVCRKVTLNILTIDHLRGSGMRLDTAFRAVFLIGGAVVPGVIWRLK
jgi:hypothetical protein